MAKKQNSKLNTDELFQKMVDWRVKNRFIKDQISKLENLKDFPVFSIAAFLLKTQLIEFELKQLIIGLDLHLSFSSTSKCLQRKIRTPKNLDDKRMGLGMVSNEVRQYQGDFLVTLHSHLDELIKSRNKFVHELFNPGTIDELIKESNDGLKIASIILKEIESIEKFLKENDPLKIKK